MGGLDNSFKSVSKLNTAAVALLGELYSRVSGQHLSSRLLCPEAAETEPPDQLQFPKGQEGWPVDGRTDRWTHVDIDEAPSLITFRPNKVEHGRIFPPPGGKNSWATTNILFFSIIKEFKAKQLSDLIDYPSSLKFWSSTLGYFRDRLYTVVPGVWSEMMTELCQPAESVGCVKGE